MMCCWMLYNYHGFTSYGLLKSWAGKNGDVVSLSTGGFFRKISGIPEVIADELVAAGHCVKHIDSTGRTENHDPHRKLPDFIVPCNEDEGGSSSRPRGASTLSGYEAYERS